MTRTNEVKPVYKVGLNGSTWKHSIELGEFIDADTRYGSGVLGVEMPLKSDPNTNRLLFNLGGVSKIIHLTTEKVASETDMNQFLSDLEDAQAESITSGDGVLEGMPYGIQNVESGGAMAVVIGDWDFKVTNQDLGGDEVIQLNLEILYGKLIGLFTTD